MSREEYIKKEEELHKKLIDLRIEYVKSNSPIPVGSKVKVTGVNTTQYGFLVGYYEQCYEVLPHIKKMKKDGTQSLVDMYVHYGSTVEICE